MATLIRKPKPAHTVTVTVKAEPGELNSMVNNMQIVAANATPEDWAALAKLVCNPAKLTMARNFM